MLFFGFGLILLSLLPFPASLPPVLALAGTVTFLIGVVWVLVEGFYLEWYDGKKQEKELWLIGQRNAEERLRQEQLRRQKQEKTQESP